MKEDEKENFLQLREAYKTISSSYLRLKKRPWKQFEQLINDLLKKHLVPAKGSILDAGCGNGRNLSLFDNYSLKIGMDPIENLVSQAPAYGGLPVLGSVTHSPFRKNGFDVIISVAVIHHFRHQETRVKAIREMLDLLRPGGFLVLTVWKRDRVGKIGEVVFKMVKGEDSQNELLPWKDTAGKTIAYRYYHYFTREEFEELLSEFEGYIVDWGSFGGKIKQNFFAVLRKKG